MTDRSIVQLREPKENGDETFGIPGFIEVSPTVMRNVEDLVEGQESRGPKEKGGKHDT
jgi:hypothetical protein